MNSLSWMLYLVGIIPNLGGMIAFFAFVSIIGGLVGIMCHVVTTNAAHQSKAVAAHVLDARRNKKNYGKNDRDYLNLTEWAAMWKTVARRALPFGLACALIAALIPGTDTMRLILASELGETAVQNEEVQEIFGLMKDRLKQELQKE